MNVSQFFTKRLPLLFTLRQCQNGPMQGEKLVLTDHSPNTAWLELNGEVGRYVADRNGVLRWEARRG